MVTRERFRTGPAPLNGGSTSGKVRWAHMPEKSGIDAAPRLGCCVNAGDENRAAAALAAMMAVRMMIAPIRTRGRACRGHPAAFEIHRSARWVHVPPAAHD